MTRFFVTLSLIVLILICTLVSPVMAEGQTTYVVQPGDTLYGIAARYAVSVSQLAAVNGLRWNSWVYVGQQLVIPGGTLVPGDPSAGVYIVKPGDTLFSIAMQHGTTVDALLAVNGLSNPNFIYTGQRLSIPGGTQSPSLPEPVTSYGERWIDVNLSTQTVTAYAGQTAVYQAIASTGLPGTPTVVGNFTIYAKYYSTTMSGADYSYPDVPYVMFFHRGYSLHGTYWHNNFGTPMSHGCVNLPTQDAEWFFNWASIGTPVITHY